MRRVRIAAMVAALGCAGVMFGGASNASAAPVRSAGHPDSTGTIFYGTRILGNTYSRAIFDQSVTFFTVSDGNAVQLCAYNHHGPGAIYRIHFYTREQGQPKPVEANSDDFAKGSDGSYCTHFHNDYIAMKFGYFSAAHPDRHYGGMINRNGEHNYRRPEEDV